jgi:hypothetical protein
MQWIIESITFGACGGVLFEEAPFSFPLQAEKCALVIDESE